MNKKQLVLKMSLETGLKQKDMEKALNAFTTTVAEELRKGEKIQLTGFGTFEVMERKAREARNPKTKEIIKIPACKMPKFKPGKVLKCMVNK